MLQRVLTVAVSAMAVMSHVASGAANIDSGFVQDGDTTYCQGVRGATSNPLEFLELEAHNVGRCPIDVLISTTATTVGILTPMEVQWAASVHQGPVPNNIFPRAVDEKTKKPQNVIASLVRACVVGTNCAPSGVVIPQVMGSADAETGAFDAQGRKALRPFKFQFPKTGDYVIVGVVTLPGDAALNVSATQFIAFQKVTVVDGLGPATVAPPKTTNSTKEIGNEGRTDNLNFGTTKPTSASALDATETGAPNRTPKGVDGEISGNTSSSTKSSTDGGLNMTMILVAGVVAALMIVATVFFVVSRNKSRALKRSDPGKPLDPDSQAGIFNLNNDQDMMMSLSLGFSGQKPHQSGGSSIAHTSSSHRSLEPPRYTATSNASSTSTDSGPFSQRPSKYPSFENAALAASGKEFKHSSKGRTSDASSCFSDLHDSAASLPVVRPSAATSYGGYSNYRQSSRLFSEGTVRDVSEYNSNFSDRYSEDSRRSTELGALSECSTTSSAVFNV